MKLTISILLNKSLADSLVFKHHVCEEFEAILNEYRDYNYEPRFNFEKTHNVEILELTIKPDINNK